MPIALAAALGCGGQTSAGPPDGPFSQTDASESDSALPDVLAGGSCGSTHCSAGQYCCTGAAEAGLVCGFECREAECANAACVQPLAEPHALCTAEQCGLPPTSWPPGFTAIDGQWRCPDGSVGGGICMRDGTGRCSWGTRMCPDAVPCRTDGDCPPDAACVAESPPCVSGGDCPVRFECMVGLERRDGGGNWCTVAADCAGPLADVCAACGTPWSSVPSSVQCAHWACEQGVCAVATCT